MSDNEKEIGEKGSNDTSVISKKPRICPEDYERRRRVLELRSRACGTPRGPQRGLRNLRNDDRPTATRGTVGSKEEGWAYANSHVTSYKLMYKMLCSQRQTMLANQIEFKIANFAELPAKITKKFAEFC